MVRGIFHLSIFVLVIFAGLFIYQKNRDRQSSPKQQIPILRVFSYGSFTSSYGPGPILKTEFEKICQCKIEFIEGTDAGILLQRLKIEGEGLGADLILGLDQFDLAKAQSEFQWQTIQVTDVQFDQRVRAALMNNQFIPYNWGIISFIGRKDLDGTLSKLDDLLKPEWKGRFALQDPRTSSPGLQFLMWIIHAKGESEGLRYLGRLLKQAHSVSGSWSQSYSLFQKRQVDLVLSYTTSVMYHLLEEKDENYKAIEFSEEHPEQFEYMAISEFCRQCELAQKFARFLLESKSQEVLMKKNFMFPVVKGLRETTEFNKASLFPTFSRKEIVSEDQVQRILKKWAEQRRNVE